MLALELLLALLVRAVFSAASKLIPPVASRLAALPAMTLAPVRLRLPLPAVVSPLAIIFNAPPATSWLPCAVL